MPRNVIKKVQSTKANVRKLQKLTQLLKHIIRVFSTCYVEIGFLWVRPLCFSALQLYNLRRKYIIITDTPYIACHDDAGIIIMGYPSMRDTCLRMLDLPDLKLHVIMLYW